MANGSDVDIDQRSERITRAREERGYGRSSVPPLTHNWSSSARNSSSSDVEFPGDTYRDIGKGLGMICGVAASIFGMALAANYSEAFSEAIRSQEHGFFMALGIPVTAAIVFAYVGDCIGKRIPR